MTQPRFDDSGALSVLALYMRRMCEWETQVGEQYEKLKTGLLSKEQFTKSAVEEYGRLFKEHCSAGATPRDFHFSFPSEFAAADNSMEDSEYLDENQVAVKVRHAKSNALYQFVLVREQGHWMVLSRNYILSDGSVLDAGL